MQKKFNIKAFTLTEIMVVMAVSAIVVGIAFSVLTVVQNNMNSITTNYEYHSKIKALEVELTIAMHQCTHIEWQPEEATLTLSSPMTTAQYRLYTDSIVTPTLTYPLVTKNVLFYRSGTVVTSGAIDAIEFDFEHTSALHRTFVYKHTDPTLYFELNHKHITTHGH